MKTYEELRTENEDLRAKLAAVKPLLADVMMTAQKQDKLVSEMKAELMSALGAASGMVLAYDAEVKKATLDGIEMAAALVDRHEEVPNQYIVRAIRQLKEKV